MRLSCTALIFPGIELGRTTIDFLLRKDIFCFKFSEFKPKPDKKKIEGHTWKPKALKLQPKKGVSGERGAKVQHLLKSRGSYLGFMSHDPGPSAFEML